MVYQNFIKIINTACLGIQPKHTGPCRSGDAHLLSRGAGVLRKQPSAMWVFLKSLLNEIGKSIQE